MPTLFLSTSLLLVASVAQARPVERRAVIVGANDGGLDLEPLHHAEQDAARMVEVLVDLGGYDRDDIVVLDTPDRVAVDAALAAAAADMRGRDNSVFFFYYSGHADSRGLRLQSDVFAWEELKASVRDVPADVHIGVLDACQSGAITRSKGRIKGAIVGEAFLGEDALAVEGEAWLAAAAASEEAQESDRLEGSFFTYYLLSGLRGAADVQGDGTVSLDEAYRYAHAHTVARTSGTAAGAQHPTFAYNMQGNGDLALTDVSRATAALVFPTEQEGLVTVLRLSDGLPVAEVSKTGGVPLRLALEPGEYLVRKRVDGELREVRVGLADGAAPVLDRWGAVQREVATLKGRTPSAPVLPPGGDRGPDMTGSSAVHAIEAAPIDGSWSALVLYEADTNHDDAPDVFTYVVPRGDGQADRTVRVEQDLNGDGCVDLITVNDPQGLPEWEYSDFDFDGVYDKEVRFRDGHVVHTAYASQGSGTADVFSYYHRGEITLKERDADGDGRIDTWERFEDGRVVRRSIDTDGDGRPDVVE